MKKAAMAARVGNRILSIMAGILILLMLSYGMYSLWDTYKIYANSFADEELLKFRPTDDGEDNPTLKDLKKLNPDVKAWIQVPKTNIDYPVVQGQDDMEYINKNVYGEFELSGAIFLSCLNKDDFSDPYNLVYGHNMKNGSMVGTLDDYKSEKWQTEHTVIEFFVDGEVREYEVFAAAESRVLYEDEEGFRYYRSGGDLSEEEYGKLITWLQENSDYETGIIPEYGEQILMLSTCSYHTKDGRFVVAARRISEP